MPFCEIKFTVLLMNSLHQIQIALQIASSCKVCASTLRLCGVVQGSVSQTESHNWLFERCPSVSIIIKTPCQAHPARFFVKCGFSSAEHVLTILDTGAHWAGNSGAAAQPHSLEEPAGDCTLHLQWPESSQVPAAAWFLKLGNAANNSSLFTLPAPRNRSQFQHREPCAEIQFTEIVLSETLRNTNIGTQVYIGHVNTENMQMLTKCDVTHQVEQLDCEVQLEEVIKL